jgi:hypothetical protein
VSIPGEESDFRNETKRQMLIFPEGGKNGSDVTNYY